MDTRAVSSGQAGRLCSRWRATHWRDSCFAVILHEREGCRQALVMDCQKPIGSDRNSDHSSVAVLEPAAAAEAGIVDVADSAVTEDNQNRSRSEQRKD